MAAEDLVTVAIAQQEPVLATIELTRLARLITAASKAVARYCGREFISAAHVEAYNGDNSDLLILRQIPVILISAVIILETDGTTTAVPVTDLRCDDARGFLRFAPLLTGSYSYWPKGFQNISVAYTAGYGAIPENVADAALLLVAWLDRSKQSAGLSSERLGEYTYTTRDTEQGWPRQVRDLLSTYREVL